MKDLIGKNTKLKIPGEKQKFFYIKFIKRFGCFSTGMAQKLHPHMPHPSYWLWLQIEQNIKDNNLRILKSKQK